MTEKKNSRKKIGLLGPVTSGNLGNAALEAAVVQRLSKEFPEDEFYVCTRDSIEGLKEYGVHPFPFRRDTITKKTGTAGSSTVQAESGSARSNPQYKNWIKRIPGLRPGVLAVRKTVNQGSNLRDEIRFLFQSYRLANGFRYLIVCGGGQLDDLWGGAWGLPYSLFTWAVLSRLAGCRFLVVSVGAEQVKTRLGRFFLRHAMNLAEYRSYRDESSRTIAERIGVAGEQYVYPDLAFGLEVQKDANSHVPRKPRRLAGISPMAYCDPRVWPEKNFEKYKAHLEVLGAFVEKLIAEEWDIVVFVSQNRMDKPALDDFEKLLAAKMPNIQNGRITFAATRNLDELLRVVGGVNQVVAARFHGVLLSLLSGTPAIALSYESKVEALMNNVALAEYCSPLQTTTADELYKKFKGLLADDDRVRQGIGRKITEFQAALEEQYLRLFRL